MAEAVIPALVITEIAATAGATYASYAAAKAQNEAIEASMKSQAEALRIQQKQLAEQAGLEKMRNIARAQQIIGRLRVAAGEAGVGIAGSYDALIRQTLYETALNEKIIQQNYLNQVQYARTAAQANMARLQGRTISPGLAAFESFAAYAPQLVNTGLAIKRMQTMQQLSGRTNV